MNNDDIRRLNQLLLLHSDGLKAREIAKELQLAKNKVNRYLYDHKRTYRKDEQFRWYMEPAGESSDPVLVKLNNRSGAEIFTYEEFSALADWTHGSTHREGQPAATFTSIDGNRIDCDSGSEVQMLKYLHDNNLIYACGGQNLCIHYNSAFTTGKSYYPDFVVLTRDMHIAVIEVKSAGAMDYHGNIEKYCALKEYCIQHGYEYMVVDPTCDYLTFEELRDRPVNRELLDMFDRWNSVPDSPVQPYKFFDDQVVKEWHQKYGRGTTLGAFRLQVHALVIRYNWYNVRHNGFKVFSKPVRQECTEQL